MLEFVGILPIVALAALLCLQSLLLALGLIFAQAAADRAARGESSASALERIPDGWRQRARIERESARVRVQLAAPVVLPVPSSLLVVTASSTEVSA